MTLLLSSVGLGLALGLLSGGRIANLEYANVRLGALLPLAFAFQAVMPLVLGPHLGLTQTGMIWALWVPPAILAIVVALLNHRTTGMLLVAVGVVSNTLVIVLNGGMPVSIGNLPPGLQSSALSGVSASWLHIPLSASTRLPYLADVFPTPGPPGLGGMASLGDVLLAMGVALCLQHIMNSPPVADGAVQLG